ncbi:MAG: hypothetical protein JWO31_4283 [Phycisphaerales bacterium]|nr:hypothetical protein [Phycisphaerales bacterium]
MGVFGNIFGNVFGNVFGPPRVPSVQALIVRAGDGLAVLVSVAAAD